MVMYKRKSLSAARLKDMMYLWLGLAVEPGNTASDALVNRLGHLLQRQTILHSLNHLGHRRLDALDTSLDGRDEVADVALPSRSPLVGLVG